MYTLQLSADKQLTITNRPLVMGILNITPDSFSDGGLYMDLKQAVEHTGQMLNDGADIIDIGAESTRPGAETVTADDELKRLMPVIKQLKREFGKSIIISVDTYKSEVAEKTLALGADMINSLGGFMFDKNMATVVARANCPIVLYHIKGNPSTMQKGEIKYDNIIKEISNFFFEQINLGQKSGVKYEQYIIDPGIGFGKTVDQNIEIIQRLKEFEELKLPLLIGLSRKRHLGMILEEELKLNETPPPDERLEATLAETAVAVLNGANIVRTHDVKETKKFLAVLNRIK